MEKSKLRILCVIPSRLGSTRLPNKPLIKIGGKPMVQWVYEHARQVPEITQVIVATDHEDIAAVIRGVGGEALLTDPNLLTGSDRVASVAALYPDMDVVINLQGDEPFVTASMLQQLLAPYLQGEQPCMTTLAYPLDMQHAYFEPGAVKVLVDKNGDALYFSRSPIPYQRQATTLPLPVYHHMGLYAFTREFLLQYTCLPPTALEQIESLEQLRVLEHGYKIRVCLTEQRSIEVNTPEDLARAEALLKQPDFTSSSFS